MSTTAPTVIVTIDGTPRKVCFTMATMLSIEQATGCGIYEVVNKFRALRPKHRLLDGELLTEEEIESLDDEQRDRLKVAQEDRDASLGNFKLSLVSSFCAGCLGMTMDEFVEVVQPSQVLEVLSELQLGFLDAVTQLNGVEEDEEVPTTPSALGLTSESSSTCAAENSAD